jgi:hypothetical protein
MKAAEYRILIKEFIDGAISAEEFALHYNDVFLQDPGGEMDRPLFDILENLWEDVEAYSPMWTPEEEGPFKITGNTLHREAIQALLELDQYLARSRGSDSRE